jgi:hypothetical protein
MMDDFSMDKRTKDKVFNEIIMDKQKPKKSSKGVKTFLVVALVVVILGALSFLVLRGALNPTGSAVADIDKSQKTVKVADASKGVEGTVVEKYLAEPADVIKNVLDLRGYSNAANTIKIAETLSWLNREIENYDIAEMKVSWQGIVGCAYQKCADSVYLSMIDTMSIKSIAKGNNDAIHSLIETYNLWNGKNQIYFSESLSRTNGLLTALKSSQVDNAWQELVACNGVCPEFAEKTFGLIKVVNSLK